MGIPLRTLIIEDSEDDTLLVVRTLQKGGYDPKYKRVETADAMGEALGREAWDVIISDNGMPHFSGCAALTLYKEKELDIPFIIVSGTIGEEAAVTAMVSGANDYVMKNNLPRLVPAVQRELREMESRRERWRAEEELRRSEEKLQAIIHNLPIAVTWTDIDGNVEYANQRHFELFGYTRDEIPTVEGWRCLAYPDEAYRKTVPALGTMVLETRAQDREITSSFEATVTCKDGSKRHVIITGLLVANRILVIFDDITERKQAEEALIFNNIILRTQQESSIDGILVVDKKGKILSFNQRFVDLWAIPPDVIEPKSDQHALQWVMDKLANPEQFIGQVERLYEARDEICKDELVLKDGRFFDRYSAPMIDTDGKYFGRVWYFRDITPRKQAEADLNQTMEKLRKNLIGTIQTISLIVETRDPYTAGHQRRVSSIARAISQEMGLPKDTVDTIRMAGAIHDIGKMSVPAEILSKPSRLTDIEMQLIRTHPQTGYDLLKEVELPCLVKEMVLQHHERLDGSGYPQGLQGDQILLGARIMAVADVVESMASHRPYRPALGIEAALEEIEKNAGMLYDAEVARICLKLFREKGFKFE